MDFFSFFQYPFFIRAIIAGILVAIPASLLGLFLVLRKLSLIGDGLSHVSFGAVSLGLFLGVYPFYASLPLTVLSSFLIFYLNNKAKVYGDAIIGIISSTGIASGVIIASLAQGFNVDLFSYLFGSLLAVSWQEIYFLIILAFITCLFIFIYYRSLFALSFDESTAKAFGVKVNFLNIILLILTSLTVAVAVKAVGVMLVSALLILPAVTALYIAKNFRSALFSSSFLAVLIVIIGLIMSILFNLPAGASIVISGLFLFLFIYLQTKLFKR